MKEIISLNGSNLLNGYSRNFEVKINAIRIFTIDNDTDNIAIDNGVLNIKIHKYPQIHALIAKKKCN